MADYNIYDDLELLSAQENQKAVEELQWKEKYQIALATIEKFQVEKKELNRKIKQLELNFASLLETARAEIKRKDNQIAELRRENDNICFRRNVRPVTNNFVADSVDEVAQGGSRRFNPFAVGLHQRETQKIVPNFAETVKRPVDNSVASSTTPRDGVCARRNSRINYREEDHTSDGARDRSRNRSTDRTRSTNENNFDERRSKSSRDLCQIESSDSSREKTCKASHRHSHHTDHKNETPANGTASGYSSSRQEKYSKDSFESLKAKKKDVHVHKESNTDNRRFDESLREVARATKNKENADNQMIKTLEEEILKDVKQMKKKKQSEAKKEVKLEEDSLKAASEKSNKFLDALFDDMEMNSEEESNAMAQPMETCANGDNVTKVNEKKLKEIVANRDGNCNVEQKMRTPLKQSVTKISDDLFGPSAVSTLKVTRTNSLSSMGKPSSDTVQLVSIADQKVEAKLKKGETATRSKPNVVAEVVIEDNSSEGNDDNQKGEQSKDYSVVTPTTTTSIKSSNPPISAKSFKFAELDSSFYSSEEEGNEKEGTADGGNSKSDIKSPSFENCDVAIVTKESVVCHIKPIKIRSTFEEHTKKNSEMNEIPVENADTLQKDESEHRVLTRSSCESGNTTTSDNCNAKYHTMPSVMNHMIDNVKKDQNYKLCQPEKQKDCQTSRHSSDAKEQKEEHTRNYLIHDHYSSKHRKSSSSSRSRYLSENDSHRPESSRSHSEKHHHSYKTSIKSRHEDSRNDKSETENNHSSHRNSQSTKKRTMVSRHRSAHKIKEKTVASALKDKDIKDSVEGKEDITDSRQLAWFEDHEVSVKQPYLQEDNSSDLKLYHDKVNSLHCDDISDSEDMDSVTEYQSKREHQIKSDGGLEKVEGETKLNVEDELKLKPKNLLESLEKNNDPFNLINNGKSKSNKMEDKYESLGIINHEVKTINEVTVVFECISTELSKSTGDEESTPNGDNVSLSDHPDTSTDDRPSELVNDEEEMECNFALIEVDVVEPSACTTLEKNKYLDQPSVLVAETIKLKIGEEVEYKEKAAESSDRILTAPDKAKPPRSRTDDVVTPRMYENQSFDCANALVEETESIKTTNDEEAEYNEKVVKFPKSEHDPEKYSKSMTGNNIKSKKAAVSPFDYANATLMTSELNKSNTGKGKNNENVGKFTDNAHVDADLGKASKSTNDDNVKQRKDMHMPFECTNTITKVDELAKLKIDEEVDYKDKLDMSTTDNNVKPRIEKVSASECANALVEVAESSNSKTYEEVKHRGEALEFSEKVPSAADLDESFKSDIDDNVKQRKEKDEPTNCATTSSKPVETIKSKINGEVEYKDKSVKFVDKLGKPLKSATDDNIKLRKENDPPSDCANDSTDNFPVDADLHNSPKSVIDDNVKHSKEEVRSSDRTNVSIEILESFESKTDEEVVSKGNAGELADNVPVDEDLEESPKSTTRDNKPRQEGNSPFDRTNVLTEIAELIKLSAGELTDNVHVDADLDSLSKSTTNDNVKQRKEDDPPCECVNASTEVADSPKSRIEEVESNGNVDELAENVSVKEGLEKLSKSTIGDNVKPRQEVENKEKPDKFFEKVPSSDDMGALLEPTTSKQVKSNVRMKNLHVQSSKFKNDEQVISKYLCIKSSTEQVSSSDEIQDKSDEQSTQKLPILSDTSESSQSLIRPSYNVSYGRRRKLKTPRKYIYDGSVLKDPFSRIKLRLSNRYAKSDGDCSLISSKKTESSSLHQRRIQSTYNLAFVHGEVAVQTQSSAAIMRKDTRQLLPKDSKNPLGQETDLKIQTTVDNLERSTEILTKTKIFAGDSSKQREEQRKKPIEAIKEASSLMVVEASTTTHSENMKFETSPKDYIKNKQQDSSTNIHKGLKESIGSEEKDSNVESVTMHEKHKYTYSETAGEAATNTNDGKLHHKKRMLQKSSASGAMDSPGKFLKVLANNYDSRNQRSSSDSTIVSIYDKKKMHEMKYANSGITGVFTIATNEQHNKVSEVATDVKEKQTQNIVHNSTQSDVKQCASNFDATGSVPSHPEEPIAPIDSKEKYKKKMLQNFMNSDQTLVEMKDISRQHKEQSLQNSSVSCSNDSIAHDTATKSDKKKHCYNSTCYNLSNSDTLLASKSDNKIKEKIPQDSSDFDAKDVSDIKKYKSSNENARYDCVTPSDEKILQVSIGPNVEKVVTSDKKKHRRQNHLNSIDSDKKRSSCCSNYEHKHKKSKKSDVQDAAINEKKKNIKNKISKSLEAKDMNNDFGKKTKISVSHFRSMSPAIIEEIDNRKVKLQHPLYFTGSSSDVGFSETVVQKAMTSSTNKTKYLLGTDQSPLKNADLPLSGNEIQMKSFERNKPQQIKAEAKGNARSKTSFQDEMDCNTIYIKRKMKSSKHTKRKINKRKLSSSSTDTVDDKIVSRSKKLKKMQNHPIVSSNDCGKPSSPSKSVDEQCVPVKRKRSLSCDKIEPTSSAVTPTYHKIFQDDVFPEDPQATLPPLYNANEDDPQYRDIDNRMRSMFQSPTYTNTNLGSSFDLPNGTSIDLKNEVSKENLTVEETLNQSERSLCDTSSSSRKISVGSNNYIIETIDTYTANVFITRKKCKKRMKIAIATV